MKKSFFKKIMILCFAVFGMVMIGNNVFAGGDENDHEEPGDGGGEGVSSCYTELTRPGEQILYSCKPCTTHIFVKPGENAKKKHC
jgi:hypothetical protein